MSQTGKLAATGRYAASFRKSDLQTVIDQSPGDSVSLAFNIGGSMSGLYHEKHWTFTAQWNHKLNGYHINGPPLVQAAVDEAIASKPMIVKVLDSNTETLQRIKANRPDTFIIYRHVFAEQPLGASENEAYNVGRSQANFMINREAVNAGVIDAIEGYNEVVHNDSEPHLHKLYCQFMLGFYDEVVSQSSLLPIAFNFATGNGDEQMIRDHYMPYIQRAGSDGKLIIGVHEYDWPHLSRLHQVGLNKPDEPRNWVPGLPEQGDGGGWLALRYRRMFNRIIQETGFDVSFIVTETGSTQGVQGGQDVGPWHPTNTISGNTHHSPLTVDEYYGSLLWYSDQLMQDPNVMGACLFVTGATGRPDWETFEHVPAITSRIRADQKEADSDTSPPDPPPNGGEMKKTQTYIQQAAGEFVGMTFNLKEGESVKFSAVADAQSGREFSHWTDHTGQRYDQNPLPVAAGSSLSLMAHFKDKQPPSDDFPPAWWPYNRPLVGLHGRNDYHWHGPDYQMTAEANIETVSFMGHTDIQSFISFNQQFPGVPISVRIYSVQMQNEYFNQHTRPSPDVYVQAVRGSIAQQSQYTKVFRVHNEPNHLHKYEGWGADSALADDFNSWSIAVLGLLRREFPDLKFLFPNLAQGGAHNDLDWFQRCLPAIEQYDGWCASCYWQNPEGNEGRHLSEDWGLRFVKYDEIAANAGIRKPVFIAEAGNSNHHTAGWPPASEEQVATELTQYYQHIMANYAGIVYAVMPFLMSSAGGWQPFAWREENGRFKQVVGAVGSMSRPPLQ